MTAAGVCVSVVVVVVACVIVGSLCCSPEGYVYRNEVQRMHDARAVVYGRVLRTFVDEMFSEMGGEVYTAEMEVYCVIKGDIRQPVINITEAGAVPGLCHVAFIRVGGEYIVTLDVDGGNYRPDESQFSPEDMDAIRMACDMTPNYPDGVTNTTFPGKQCPVMAGPDDCTPYTDPRGPMVIVPEPTKESREPVTEAEPVTEPQIVTEAQTVAGAEPVTEAEPTAEPRAEPDITTKAEPQKGTETKPTVFKFDPPVLDEQGPSYSDVGHDSGVENKEETTTKSTPAVAAVEDRENGAGVMHLATVTMLCTAFVLLLHV